MVKYSNFNEVFIIIILFIIFYINEKCNLVSYVNLLSFKNIIKNILLVLPFITVYLGQDSVINLLKKNKKNKNKNQRSVSESTKKVVASNQKWNCNYCSNMLDATYEIDHIVPLYKGGDNNINNLQALCRNCHGKKTLIDKINI